MVATGGRGQLDGDLMNNVDGIWAVDSDDKELKTRAAEKVKKNGFFL